MLKAGWEVGPQRVLSITSCSKSPLGWWHHRVLMHDTAVSPVQPPWAHSFSPLE